MAELSHTGFDAEALADMLFSLRGAGSTAPTSDFPLPDTLPQAMQAQGALAGREGTGGNAWKVAMTPDKQPVVARLHPYLESARNAELPFLPGMKFEVEIAVRLGHDLPVRVAAYSRSDVLEAISQVHVGCELLSSAVEESGRVSFPLYVADRIGNRGYVLGPEVPKALIDEIGGLPMRVTLGGAPVHDGPARHPAGDPLDWLVAFSNDRTRPDGSLAAGMVVTTGALSGAMPLAGPGRVDVLVGPDHAMSVTLVA